MSARQPGIRNRFWGYNIPLRVALVSSVALQVLAITALTGYFSFRHGQKAIYDLTVQLRNHASSRIQNQINTYLSAPHQLNQIKSNEIRLDHVNADDFEKLRPYLLAQLQVFNSVTNTGIATNTGDYISVGRQIDGSFSNPVIDRSQGQFFQYGLSQNGDRTEVLQALPYQDPRLDTWYRNAITAGEATWSPIFPWTFKEFGIGLMAAQPVYDETGKQVGVVNSGLVLDHISEFLRNLETAELAEVFVVERSGLLVATSNGESPVRRSDNQNTTERISALESQDSLIRLTTQYLINQFGDLAQIQTSQQIEVSLEGKWEFIQLTPVVDSRGIDWLMVIVIPESAFAEQIDANTQTTLWLCLVALLLSASSGFLTARWLAMPIRRLSQSVEALTGNNLEHRVEHQHGIKEINVLAQSFNQMAKQLQVSFTDVRQSEEKFRQLAENIQEVFWLSDPEAQQCLYVSPAYETIWGRSCESVYANPQSFVDAIHPDDRQQVINNLIENATRRFEIEYRVVQPNGNVRWVCDRCFPIYDASGTVIRRAGVVKDITEARQAREALQNSERRSSTLINNLPGYVYRAANDVNYTAEFISEGVFAISGYQPDEYLTERSISCGQTIHPDDRDSVWAVVQEAVEQQQPYEYECRIITKSGHQKWVWGRGHGVFADSGEFLYLEGFVTDISDRKRSEVERAIAENALYASESRYRQVVETQTDFILQSRPDTTITFANQALCRALGTSLEQMIGRKWTDFAHQDDLQQGTLQQLTQLTPNNSSFWTENRDRRADGQLGWTQWINQGIFDEQGQLIEIQSVGRDITALKQTTERERLMRVMTERIRQSLNLDDILTKTVTEVRDVLRADRVILLKVGLNSSGYVVQESVDANWQSILGQTLHDPCLRSTPIHLHPEGQVRAIANIDDGSIQPCYANFLKQFEVRASLVVPIIQADHLWGLLIAHQCAQPRHWSDNEIQLLQQLADQVAIAIQQSELYQQLQQLNANLENQVQQRTEALQQALEFESLLQRIADKVRETLDEQQVIHTAIDELSRVLHSNGCGIGLFDLEQETSTLCYAELAPDVPSLHDRVFHFASYPELYQQLLRGEQVQFCGIFDHSYPTLLNQAKGTLLVCPLIDIQSALGELWLYRTGEVVFTDAEVRLVQQVANQCAIGIRQSRLYQSTQIQVETLEQLHRMKDDFLSTVSHELRSPLANIKMAIQMVKLRLNQHQTQDDRLSQYLQILEEGCNQELVLINDLLDLQRLEAGVQLLELESVDLNYWLPSIAEPFQARAQEQQQQLNLELPPNLPLITTDITGLKRIVVELLHNACKYTPPQEQITLTAQVRDTTLHIQVCNSGVELPAEELPHLFKKFYRVAGVDRWKHGGTGLGLALVKRLVEHLNGSIEVESTNALTCFTVQLPLNI